jgi:hypothetical protein
MNIMEDAPAAPVAMCHRLQERDTAAAQVAGTTTQTEMGLGWAGVNVVFGAYVSHPEISNFRM